MECKYDDFVNTVKQLAVSSGCCPAESVDAWYQACHIHVACRTLASHLWAQGVHPAGSQETNLVREFLNGRLKLI